MFIYRVTSIAIDTSAVHGHYNCTNIMFAKREMISVAQLLHMYWCVVRLAGLELLQPRPFVRIVFSVLKELSFCVSVAVLSYLITHIIPLTLRYRYFNFSVKSVSVIVNRLDLFHGWLSSFNYS